MRLGSVAHVSDLAFAPLRGEDDPFPHLVLHEGTMALGHSFPRLTLVWTT